MKINFTKKEYRQLLDLVFVGHWIVTATDEGAVESPYDAIQQKVFSFAKEMGCEDLVEYAKEFDKYFNTADLEDELMGYIDKYEKEVMTR